MAEEQCGRDRTQVAVLDHRVTKLENVIESIDNSLKALVALEVKHTQTATALERAFGEIEKHNIRIVTVENEMPTLKLIRGWVVAGVLGVFAIFGTALVYLVIK